MILMTNITRQSTYHQCHLYIQRAYYMTGTDIFTISARSYLSVANKGFVFYVSRLSTTVILFASTRKIALGCRLKERFIDRQIRVPAYTRVCCRSNRVHL